MIIELTLITAWVILQIGLGVWLFRAKPSKAILKKYPKMVIYQSTVPLLKSWRNKVEPNDLRVLEEYRRRFIVQYYICFVVSVFLFFVYLYFKYIHFE